MPKQADMTPLTDAQRDLAASCVKMAAMLADKASRRRPRLADEYLSDAMLALVQSVKTYDPGIAKFSTYSYLGVSRGLRNTKRNNLPAGCRVDKPKFRIPRTVSLARLPYRMEPCGSDPEPFGLEGFDKLVARLPKRGRLILKYRFVDDMTLAEIGRKFRVTRQRAQQEYEEAIDALRQRA